MLVGLLRSAILGDEKQTIYYRKIERSSAL
jgi:hypothetical protein